MFNFGEFYEIEQDQANFSVWELALFVLIGSLGGLVGAATVHVSAGLTRRRLGQCPAARQREVLAVACAASAVAFGVPLWCGACTLQPDPEDAAAAYTSQVARAQPPPRGGVGGWLGGWWFRAEGVRGGGGS
jgi:hypothetical protein